MNTRDLATVVEAGGRRPIDLGELWGSRGLQGRGMTGGLQDERFRASNDRRRPSP